MHSLECIIDTERVTFIAHMLLKAHCTMASIQFNLLASAMKCVVVSKTIEKWH